MMRSLLHIVTLIILNFTADCGAQVHVVYKSVGDKAHLTLKEHWDITAVKWRKDLFLIAKIENEMAYMKHPEKYHIHFPDKSLFIHNLTVKDSGDYLAQGGQWDEKEIKYRLVVQEPVSKPIMDTAPDHQSNSSSVCRILVKCSADGESVMYDCNHQHCTRTNATSTRVNITINYTDTNEMLECTASNRVSTKRTSIPINNTCSEEQPVPTTTMNYTLGLIIIISCTLVFGVLVICVKICNNSTKTEQETGTDYTEEEKPLRAATLADSSATQNATTVYYVPTICNI